jgi:hypothetical protein
VIVEFQVQLDHKVNMDQLDLKVILVSLALLDLKDLKVNMDQLVQSDPLDLKALKVLLDR